jgi:hypothetical protein
MIEIQNPKHAHDFEKTNISKLFWSLDIVICNLFVICLPAVFLAGCLLFEILTSRACVLFFS